MSREKAGIVYALIAYFVWGLLPAYWKLLLSVSHVEILAQRVLWATVFLGLVAVIRMRGKALRALRESRKHLGALTLSASLIGVNWFTYIHAVNSGNILAGSLGYFINPLLNVFLGWALLREKLSFWQWVSVALAAIGVLELALQSGQFPVTPLILATTFSFYGFVRKRVPIEPIVASAVESAMLTPFAIIYLFSLMPEHGPALGHPPAIWFWLLGAGAATALPLLWFAEAAQRLRYSILGYFQYIAPSLQFLLAVLAYGEPFTRAQAIAFGLIWTGLAIFCADLALGLSFARKARSPKLGKA